MSFLCVVIKTNTFLPTQWQRIPLNAANQRAKALHHPRRLRSPVSSMTWRRKFLQILKHNKRKTWALMLKMRYQMRLATKLSALSQTRKCWRREGLINNTPYRKIFDETNTWLRSSFVVSRAAEGKRPFGWSRIFVFNAYRHFFLEHVPKSTLVSLVKQLYPKNYQFDKGRVTVAWWHVPELFPECNFDFEVFFFFSFGSSLFSFFFLSRIAANHGLCVRQPSKNIHLSFPHCVKRTPWKVEAEGKLHFFLHTLTTNRWCKKKKDYIQQQGVQGLCHLCDIRRVWIGVSDSWVQSWQKSQVWMGRT